MFDGELGLDVEPVHHFRELLERNLPVEVFVRLDNRPVDQLLQLQVGQVVAHHHLQHGEEFAVGDVPISVDIVDAEGELQLLLIVGSVQCGDSFIEKRVPSKNSLKEIFPSALASKTEMTLLTSGF